METRRQIIQGKVVDILRRLNGLEREGLKSKAIK